MNKKALLVQLRVYIWNSLVARCMFVTDFQGWTSPQKASGPFFDRWGDCRCNSSHAASLFNMAPTLFDNDHQLFQHFRLNAPLAMFLQPWGMRLLPCVFLARATRTRETRRAGHGEIAHGGTPRSACPSPTLPQAARGVCLQSALLEVPDARGGASDS